MCSGTEVRGGDTPLSQPPSKLSSPSRACALTTLWSGSVLGSGDVGGSAVERVGSTHVR
jgi:hypothetical protein